MRARLLARIGRLVAAALLLALPGCERSSRWVPTGAAGADGLAGSRGGDDGGNAGVQADSDPLEPLHKRASVVVLDGDIAYVGTSGGVVAMLLSGDGEPRRLASVILPGSVTDISVWEPSVRVAVATGTTGLAVIDTREVRSGQLQVLGSHPWTAERRSDCHAVWRIVPVGAGRAVVACGAGGIGVADLSSAEPAMRQTLTMPGAYARDVHLLHPNARGGEPRLVVAALGTAGVGVADLSGAGAPRWLGRVAATHGVRSVAVADGFGYVADGTDLRVLEVRNPSEPLEVARLPLGTRDMSRSILVSGTVAYVSAGDSGVVLVDIEDSRAPRIRGRFDPSRAVGRAVIRGSIWYGANDDAGILVLDVRDAASPRQIYPVVQDAG